MSQTDRILPRYFLSRVRVSVRPRIFYTRKNSQPTVDPITDRPRHRPSERRNNLKGILYLHARWRLTSQFTQMVTDDFVGAPKPPQPKRKLSALQRSSQARQRMRRCGSSLTGNLHMRILRVTPNASWAKIVSENRWISGLTGLTAGNHALNRLLKVLKSTMKNCFL